MKSIPWPASYDQPKEKPKDKVSYWSGIINRIVWETQNGSPPFFTLQKANIFSFKVFVSHGFISIFSTKGNFILHGDCLTILFEEAMVQMFYGRVFEAANTCGTLTWKLPGSTFTVLLLSKTEGKANGNYSHISMDWWNHCKRSTTNAKWLA